jgi:amino-acid N-acetyltransferase
MRDIPGMLALINGFATQGIMLPRTEFELAESIRDFLVADNNGSVIGCGALRFYTVEAAEVRSLAVSSTAQGLGVGRAIVLALEQEARLTHLSYLFAFTYVPAFFSKLGFGQVDRSLLPLKVWKDCMRCSKFQNCDEIAVVKILKENYLLAEPHDARALGAVDDQPISLPILSNKSFKL